MDQRELISAYLEGKLSKEDRKLFEALIEENPSYQTQVEIQRKETAYQSVGRTASDSRPVESLSKLKSWLFSAVIACGLVLTGYLLWVTLVKSPGEKLYAKYYEPFPYPSSGPAQENSGDLTSRAFSAYAQGDFETAATEFEQMGSRPKTGYGPFLLGICYLETGRPEKAIPVLNQIRDDSTTPSKEIASWFEAMGYLKLNMPDKAKAPLKITASTSNPYQKQADTILKSLN